MEPVRKVMFQVTAGQVVDVPDESFTREWTFSREDLAPGSPEGKLTYAEACMDAQAYYAELCAELDRISWVNLYFIWI